MVAVTSTTSIDWATKISTSDCILIMISVTLIPKKKRIIIGYGCLITAENGNKKKGKMALKCRQNDIKIQGTQLKHAGFKPLENGIIIQLGMIMHWIIRGAN
jgi:hypothetical protein